MNATAPRNGMRQRRPRPQVLTAAETLRLCASQPAQATLPTGFPELDALIGGGFKSRQLAVIAAPTGDGKTALSSVIARNIAELTPVVFATTEIDADEQSARFAAIEFFRIGQNVTPDDILAHRVEPTAAAEVIRAVRLFVLDLEAEGVRGDPFGALEDAFVTTEARFGVVDYLQLLECDQDPRRSVTLAAKTLRRLARKLDVAILAISSVSRAYYGRAKKKAADGELEDPIDWLAAAKDGGEIEYASAVFAYLDKSPEVDECGESAARLVVAKARRGRRGFVGLRMHGPTGHFEPALLPRRDPVVEEQARQALDQADEGKAIAFLQRTALNPQPRRIARTQLGMRGQRADAVIDRLIVAGRVAEVPPADPKRRGKVLVLAEHVHTHGTNSEPRPSREAPCD